MTALDAPSTPHATAIELHVPVPSSPDDPAMSWTKWLTTAQNTPIDATHPLAELSEGTSLASWTGTLYSGNQPWRVRADRVGQVVAVYAWMADELLKPQAAERGLARDVTGRVLGTEQLAQADELFRGTIESLHQALYLYRPIWHEGRIVDLEIIYCNDAALALPFTEGIVPGALASNVFKNPELAMLEAEEVWAGGQTEPYSIERTGLIEGHERTIRYEVRTKRVGEVLLQTSTDRTVEDEAARSEARQRVLLDALGEGVTLLEPMFDDDGGAMVGTRVVYQNAAAARMRESGVQIFTGASSDIRELDIVRLTWETGNPAVSVIDNIDGSDPTVPTVRIELEAMRVGAWVVQIARDRTEAFTSMRARQAAERRFKGTIEALSEAVGIWDPLFDADGRVKDFRLTYANPSLARLVPLGARAAYMPSTADIVAMGRTAMVLKGEPITLTMGLEVDGQVLTWRVSLVQVDGQVVSVGSDISEMQELLGQVSTSDKLLRSVLDSLTESVRVTNRDGRIEYSNDASLKILGPIPTEGDPAKHYHTTWADGTEMAPDDWPRARGLRGETVSDMLVAVHRDGEPTRICSIAVRPLYDEGDDIPTRVVVSAHDITEITRHAEQIEWHATHSDLTHLPNREGFVHLLGHRIEQARGSFAVIWINLAELDTIRPTFGFSAADAALVVAAERLAGIAERIDAVAGHPEDSALALLVPHVASGAEVQRIAQEIVQELGRTVTTDAMSLALGPVAGFVIGPLHGNDAESLMRRAKTAAWHAGRNGTNSVRWRADLGNDQVERVTLLGEFDRAIQEEEVFLEFQPKVATGDHRLVGAEALVRWMHPERGRIMPGSFVAAVEASALSRPFTLWAIRSALRQWAPVVERCPGAKVAVNVPVPLICDLEFMEQLADELVSLGVDPAWLQIEITERGLVGNIDDIQAGLEQLSMLGISIALDDFGTGQSSLAFLRRLTIDEVKVDRTFIQNLQSDASNKAVVAACVAIASTNRMKVCAEGVETDEEMVAATQLGCDHAQGYLFGRPMPVGQLLAKLAE